MFGITSDVPGAKTVANMARRKREKVTSGGLGAREHSSAQIPGRRKLDLLNSACQNSVVNATGYASGGRRNARSAHLRFGTSQPPIPSDWHQFSNPYRKRGMQSWRKHQKMKI
jgi:hypothetical protein